jgi:putative endonuclease
MFFVYILYSEVHLRFYIGQTNNIDDRLLRHNSGKEKSTAPYKPWELLCSIIKETRSEAMILEKKLKNLNSEDLRKFIVKYGIVESRSRGIE